jgi:hypothetical protein
VSIDQTRMYTPPTQASLCRMDRTDELVRRNRELLAVAAEVTEWARDAIMRAEQAVQDTIRIKIARKQARLMPVAASIDKSGATDRPTGPA